MAGKAKQQAAADSGTSKTARASMKAGGGSGMADRSPKVELQVFYQRSGKGGLAQRTRLVETGTPFPEETL